MKQWRNSCRQYGYSSWDLPDRTKTAGLCLRHASRIATGLLLLCAAGCHSVSLERWWDNIADPDTIGIDPMGGSMLLYWLDDDGHVCHGEPGVTGQPGPVRMLVAATAAIEAAEDEDIVTSAQLADYQVTIYYINNYLESGAYGLHFFQFDNQVWRSRSTNRAFRDHAAHRYSIPQVINLRGRPSTLYPVFATGHPGCAVLDDHLLFPDMGNPMESEPPQHPTHCRTRSMPDADGLSEEVLLSYCSAILEGGI